MQAAVLAEPALRRAGVQPHQSGVFPTARKLGLRFKEAPDRAGEESRLVVCDPQGSGGRTLQSRLLAIEPALQGLAAAYDDVAFVIAEVDKSRQSAINKLGGERGAGDSSMEAHFDILVRAATMLGGADEQALRLTLRLNQISDEAAVFCGGRGLAAGMAAGFGNAIKQARREADLRRYRYTLIAPFGVNEAFDHDLYSFSRALRNPDMCVSCKYSVSDPRRVTGRERPGFIMDELRRLDNKEDAFFWYLPESFKGATCRGLAEVQTPFQTSLTKLGIGEMGRGAYAEIKLAADERDAKALLPFTRDTALWLGTRKGHAEIFSTNFGMRGFNTFFGRGRTNGILTPITHAMHDLAAAVAHELARTLPQEAGTSAHEPALAVLPVNGCYLKYWVDLPDSAFTAERIKKAIERRIRGEGPAPGYANLDFTPSVTLLDAGGVDISQTRAMFILKSLGMGHLPHEVLDMSDFVLNFVENIHPIVQGVVFGRLSSEGGGRLTDADRSNIEALRRICGLRRTIRDTEDFVWVLRRDESLPEDIKSRRGEIERWLIEFSAEKAGRVFRILAEEISRFARRK
jgi:hypothetical protein